MRVLRVAVARYRLPLLGLFVASLIAGSVRLAYAMQCGCSGPACGGCTIKFTNCTYCDSECSTCSIWGTEDCNVGWQCPD